MADFRRDLYRHYVTTRKGGAAPRSDAALQSYFASCRAWFLPLLEGLDPHAPVLELGCGPGHLLRFLRLQGFTNVQGIDVSQQQVAIAQASGLDAAVADAWEFLPTRGAAFDAILAIDFIEHFTKDELLDLLPLVRDALRPGGRLVVQTPNGRGLLPGDVIYGDLTHMTIFTEDSLAQLLRLVGFERCVFRETRPVATGIKSWFRVLLWHVIRWELNLVRRIEAGKHQHVWTENLICCCSKAPAPKDERRTP